MLIGYGPHSLIHDASVNAVVETLILCSVKNVNMTLKEVKRVLQPGGLYVFMEHVAAKDGTLLRFVQRVLDPLEQTLADGCHLSRETGNSISNAGFSSVELNTTFVSSAAFTNLQVYGIASSSITRVCLMFHLAFWIACSKELQPVLVRTPPHPEHLRQVDLAE